MGSVPEPADPWRIAEDCIIHMRVRENPQPSC